MALTDGDRRSVEGWSGMGGCRFGVERRKWELPFLAEPSELASMRKAIRRRLELWGLSSVAPAAQLCVTELASNVIKHVGTGTPSCLEVSMSGSYVRIEVSDPDGRRLPTLVRSDDLSEQGRGVALVDGVAARWGVILRGDSKVTWCEIATDLQSPDSHIGSGQVAKAEALLGLCGLGERAKATRPRATTAREAAETATGLIADLLLWLAAHGFDADEALDRAQLLFEAESDPGFV
ncbi:ATP-binding protein [Streptomyces sp. NPDC097595]|uniref:ATP-binding protein n=1 Tax=Streptomyces sp. NPDC097595 TaxID=3366090 RepID=UPI003804FB97